MEIFKFCRFCLKNVLKTNSKMLEINEDIRELYYEFIQLKLENYAKLSNFICEKCYNDLIKCIEIKRLFIKNQEKLAKGCPFGSKNNYDENIETENLLNTINPKACHLQDPVDNSIINSNLSTNTSKNTKLQNHRSKKSQTSYIPNSRQCTVCGIFVKNLTEHLKFTHNQATKSFYCDYCSYSCHFKTKIERHIQRHIPKEFRNLHQCPECTFLCSRKDALKAHILTMHQIDRRKTYICQHCAKLFYNTSQLNIHIKSVHQNIRNNLCQHCGKGFFTSKDLKTHVKRHFPRNEKCPECDALFYCKIDLKRHLKHKHMPASITCEMPNCQRKFHTNSQMKSHIKTKHENLKEFICSYCGAKFGQYNNMKRHVDAIHKALRIYCPVENCSYSITRKDKYKIHLLKFHKDLDQATRDGILKNVKLE